MRPKPAPWALVLLALALLAFLPSGARATQIGPQTSYSAAEIQAAVEAAPGYNASLMSGAGSLGIFESSGNAGVYNDSCCTGIFQINTSNLAAQGLTRDQYANMSLSDQAATWVKVTNSAASASSVQTLQNMQANGQTFDGQPVDSSMILACVQLGTGNCQTMLNSGSCNGFTDSNGTSICDMAAKIRDGSPSQNSATTSSSTQTTAANGGSDAFAATDASKDVCWSCETIVAAFNMMGAYITKLAPVYDKGFNGSLPKLFAVIFAVVLVFQIGRNIIFIHLRHGAPNNILGMSIRFVIVMAILQIGDINTKIVQPYLLDPAIGLGAQIGAKAGSIATTAFKAN